MKLLETPAPRHWHEILRDLAVSAVCVVVSVAIFSIYLTERRTTDNSSRTLSALEGILSPGAQAKQAAVTRGAIVRIQCDSRQAIVDAFHTLSPTLHIHLPGTPGIPGTPTLPATPGVPDSGVPEIPAIPGCPPIDVP